MLRLRNNLIRWISKLLFSWHGHVLQTNSSCTYLIFLLRKVRSITKLILHSDSYLGITFVWHLNDRLPERNLIVQPLYTQGKNSYSAKENVIHKKLFPNKHKESRIIDMTSYMTTVQNWQHNMVSYIGLGVLLTNSCYIMVHLLECICTWELWRNRLQPSTWKGLHWPKNLSHAWVVVLKHKARYKCVPIPACLKNKRTNKEMLAAAARCGCQPGR